MALSFAFSGSDLSLQRVNVNRRISLMVSDPSPADDLNDLFDTDDRDTCSPATAAAESGTAARLSLMALFEQPLPDGVTQSILSFLGASGLCSLAQCAHRYHDMVQSSTEAWNAALVPDAHRHPQQDTSGSQLYARVLLNSGETLQRSLGGVATQVPPAAAQLSVRIWHASTRGKSSWRSLACGWTWLRDVLVRFLPIAGGGDAATATTAVPQPHASFEGPVSASAAIDGRSTHSHHLSVPEAGVSASIAAGAGTERAAIAAAAGIDERDHLEIAGREFEAKDRGSAHHALNPVASPPLSIPKTFVQGQQLQYAAHVSHDLPDARNAIDGVMPSFVHGMQTCCASTAASSETHPDPALRRISAFLRDSESIAYALPAARHQSVKKAVLKLATSEWLPFYDCIRSELQVKSAGMRMRLLCDCEAWIEQLLSSQSVSSSSAAAASSASTSSTAGQRASLSASAACFLACAWHTWVSYRAWFECIDSFLGPLNLAIGRERDRRAADGCGQHTPYVYDAARLAFRKEVMLGHRVRRAIQVAAGVMRSECERLLMQLASALHVPPSACCNQSRVGESASGMAASNEVIAMDPDAMAAFAMHTSTGTAHTLPSNASTQEQRRWRSMIKLPADVVTSMLKEMDSACTADIDVRRLLQQQQSSSTSASTVWRQITSEGDEMAMMEAAAHTADEGGAAATDGPGYGLGDDVCKPARKRQREERDYAAGAAAGSAFGSRFEDAVEKRFRYAPDQAGELQLEMACIHAMQSNDAAAEEEEEAALMAVRALDGGSSRHATPTHHRGMTYPGMDAGGDDEDDDDGVQARSRAAAAHSSSGSGVISTPDTAAGPESAVTSLLRHYAVLHSCLRNVREVCEEVDVPDDALDTASRPTQSKHRKLLLLPARLAVAASSLQ